MTKKLVIDVQAGKEEIVDLTAEEEAQTEKDIANAVALKEKEEAEYTANENLKASAKAKLMAGEPMTEEEANLTLHIN